MKSEVFRFFEHLEIWSYTSPTYVLLHLLQALEDIKAEQLKKYDLQFRISD